MHPGFALIVSYLSGSVPSAYLAGRWSGVDLRAHGSGNLGATNVLRMLGPRVGAAVFAADAAKGALPVHLLPALTGATGLELSVIQIACGVAAILGHARPMFLGFRRGGKGVATAFGVFLALAPIETTLALSVFAVVVYTSGYVSLASISGATALPVLLGASFGLRSPLPHVGILALLFVLWTHRANIARLRSGAEYRFDRSAKLGKRTSITLGAAVLALAAAFLAARGR